MILHYDYYTADSFSWPLLGVKYLRTLSVFANKLHTVSLRRYTLQRIVQTNELKSTHSVLSCFTEITVLCVRCLSQSA